jgi:hypothetical protein
MSQKPTRFGHPRNVVPRIVPTDGVAKATCQIVADGAKLGAALLILLTRLDRHGVILGSRIHTTAV